MHSTLKNALRRIRAICTGWIAEPTLGHLEAIRTYEFEVALSKIPATGRVLEVGAGTGWQARAFEQRGYQVSGIDLASSNYQSARIWPVTDYDGHTIPFADGAFDVVFSSNTLEHIPHVREFQAELRRVLAPNGVVVHLVPTSTWRFWSSLTHILKWWTLPHVHGEHASNAWTELRYFRRGWWVRLFRETGWTVELRGTNGLFYTGSSIMDTRIGMPTRHLLSFLLGSSCHLFVLRK